MTSLQPETVALFCVEIRTARWPELVAWYRHALGLRVLMRGIDEGYALVAAGTARLALLARADAPPDSRRWSLAFEVHDLDAARARLEEAGTAAPSPTAHAEGFRELVVSDPDGNRVRLFEWPRHG